MRKWLVSLLIVFTILAPFTYMHAHASPSPEVISNKAMIVYGEGVVTTPRYREWDGSTLGSELTGPTMGATIHYVVLKSCVGARYEKMLVVSEDEGDVFASVWDKVTGWGTVKTLGTAILDDAASRGFHVAYEQSSGDCMIVVRSGADVKYWIWDGSSWTVDGTTLDLTVTTGDPRWVRLASDPLSDEIAMIWLADSQEVGGAIWSGSAWGNQQLLESGNTVITTEMLDKECIAVEYMANNGKAMFTWGADDKPTNADCAIGARVWNGASWDSPLAYIPYGLGRDTYPPFWLSLKADPNSNQLMLAVTDDDSDFNTIRWSGATWDSQVEHDTSIEAEDARCADVEWETASGHSGHAIATWNTGVDAVETNHWDGSAWGTAFSTDPYNELIDQNIHQLRRTGDGKIFLSMVDDDSDLHVWYWNSTAWVYSGSGLGEIETTVSGGTLFEPFEFAPDARLHAPTLSVSPTSVVNPGTTFSVNITIGNATVNVYDLMGYEFKLGYNTTLLDATDATVGDFFSSYKEWKRQINDPEGYVAFIITLPLGTTVGVTGYGTLGTINFSITTGPGDCVLDLYETKLTDSAANLIPHNIVDGYFQTTTAVPEFALGVAMEIGLVMVMIYVWWKRRRKTKII